MVVVVGHRSTPHSVNILLLEVPTANRFAPRSELLVSITLPRVTFTGATPTSKPKAPSLHNANEVKLWTRSAG
eukprot:9501822-Alexandrium_andersonii.AAC.1